MRRQGRSLVVVEREPIPLGGSIRLQGHPPSIDQAPLETNT